MPPSGTPAPVQPSVRPICRQPIHPRSPASPVHPRRGRAPAASSSPPFAATAPSSRSAAPHGLLLECAVQWLAEDGVTIDPYGLEILPELAALARQRLPHWADRIIIGNALDWMPDR